MARLAVVLHSSCCESSNSGGLCQMNLCKVLQNVLRFRSMDSKALEYNASSCRCLRLSGVLRNKTHACLHSAIMSLAMTSALPCAHAKAGCNTKAFRPQARSASRVARSSHVVKASVADMELVPDSNRRTVMNLLLVGAIGLPVASLAGYALKQLLFLHLMSVRTHRLNTLCCLAGLSFTSSYQSRKSLQDCLLT